MHWTRWGNAEGVALPMRIAMAFAMTLMNAWARSMPAAFATGRELFTIVVALRCQQAIAIAMATPWMLLENAEDRAPKMRTAMVFAMTLTTALEALTHWACAMVLALQTRTTMAFAMMQTIALVISMHVAFATVQVRYTSADVPTFQRAIATAMETRSTCWANVVVPARPMPMLTAFATMWTLVLVNTTNAAYATGAGL